MKAKLITTATPTTGNPRGKGSYNSACDVCARKKTKCDGQQPKCGPCINQGRESECRWTKNPARKPRTEMNFEAVHKSKENNLALAQGWRRYAEYVESLLARCPSYHYGSVDYRAHRPVDDGTLPVEFDHDFDYTLSGTDDDAHADTADPTKDICRPPPDLKFEPNGTTHFYGNTAPFRFDRIDLPRQPSRFPTGDSPDLTYVLLVDGVDENLANPGFDWSRYLPREVPLDRRSHDKALDLLFKFFTSWCMRVIPQLFFRDMYRCLSIPKSQPLPRTAHYSPMLHNALVALALAMLDEHRFRDLSARKYYADRAKSYIETECQKPTLSVVHALSILASFQSSQGDQTLGYMYFGMSARMSQALGLSIDCSEWVRLGKMTSAERLDRHWTNWTTFSQDICWSLYVGRDYCVSVPSEQDATKSKDITMPYVDEEFDQMPWEHKASGIAPQPNYLTKTFQAMCELFLISRRIMDVVNGLHKSRSKPLALDELISEIDLNLNTWNNALAPELQITLKSRPTATPHKLMLHLAYWWLFILLHRPFFRRKAHPIHITDREIDHVKLCKRAADNIMENLATWRTLYGLRYCPITLIQAVFSAGTIYLLTSIQAANGQRVAQKELRIALGQQKLVLQYLTEIGKSWQCATNLAGIMQKLVTAELKPLLDRHTEPTAGPSSGSPFQLPSVDEGEEDHEEQGLPKSLSKRRQILFPSQGKAAHRFHSREHSVSEGAPLQSTPPTTLSPTIMISPARSEQFSQSQEQGSFGSFSSSSPISIRRNGSSSSLGPSKGSGSHDQWALRPPSLKSDSLCPSPATSPVFDSNFSVPEISLSSSPANSFTSFPLPHLPAGSSTVASSSDRSQQNIFNAPFANSDVLMDAGVGHIFRQPGSELMFNDHTVNDLPSAYSNLSLTNPANAVHQSHNQIVSDHADPPPGSLSQEPFFGIFRPAEDGPVSSPPSAHAAYLTSPGSWSSLISPSSLQLDHSVFDAAMNHGATGLPTQHQDILMDDFFPWM